MPAPQPKPLSASNSPPLLACWCMLIGAGIAWRLLRYALNFPFWGDEAYLNISILHRDFTTLLQPLEYAQVAPLLYMWIQRAVYLVAGGHEYSLRACSLLAGVSALLLFARWSRRSLPPTAALLATGIFAATYYLVRHTCESKPYAGDLLAAMILFHVGSSWQHNPQRRAPALYATAAAAILVWFSYPAIFVAGGVSLALLPAIWHHPTRKTLGSWAIYNFATGISFGLYYWLYVSAAAQRAAGSWLEDYWQHSFPPANLLALPRWLLEIHAGRMLAYPLGGADFGSSLTLLLCIAGAVWLWRQPHRHLLVLLIMPALLTLVAAALRQYPYGGSVRVAIHLAPAICALAGAGFASLLKPLAGQRRLVLVHGVCGFLILLVLGGMARDIWQPYKTPADERRRAVMHNVAANVNPGMQIGIHNPEQGTHGPPDGPAFHQSLRYYLELYTGTKPRWREFGEWAPDIDVVLVYHGPRYGPSMQRVGEVARHVGLRLIDVRQYPLSARTPEALHVVDTRPHSRE